MAQPEMTLTIKRSRGSRVKEGKKAAMKGGVPFRGGVTMRLNRYCEDS
ncbi:hypothetical protein [Prosthecochloris sp.]|nr:hypothetical protein [Prosthecochloris sp.]